MATATFEYKVRDRSGKLKSGKLEAESAGAGRRQAQDAWATRRSASRRPTTGLQREITLPGLGGKKVDLKDLAVFSRQFATMINSGLSLLRALKILVDQTENTELARVLGRRPQRHRERAVAVVRAWPSTRRSSRR